jgi:hypothetical protein
MLDYNDIQEKENRQSHSFVLFDQGPPYCELGWKSYKIFNEMINQFLFEFKKEHGVVVYLYEHEIIMIERAFLWGFSFFEESPKEREKLTYYLKRGIYDIMEVFPTLKDRGILNNHENGFELDMDLAQHYADLVMGADYMLNHTYTPPKEKTYTKELIDLNKFKEHMTTSDFKKLVHANTSLSSSSDLSYIFALDGYHSNKYRENKYLREEFVPIIKYLKYKSIPDSSIIYLGIEKENFDAKITDTSNGKEIILEITSGGPKDDHLLLSLINQSNGVFPLLTKAKLKKEFDSLPSRIIKSIQHKHNKNYKDKRVLLVTVPSEYTYQAEDYVIKEILKEVRASVHMGKGNFTEVIM